MHPQYTSSVRTFLLTPPRGDRTLRRMGGHRFVFVGGGVWHLFRFVVVALLVVRLTGYEPLFHVSILWIASPALLLVALFAGIAFLGHVERAFLPVVRIGQLLAAVADASVVLTGSYVPVAERVGGPGDGISRLVFVIVFGVLAADLLIFAALISYRPMDHSDSPQPREHLPRYESTDVEDE